MKTRSGKALKAKFNNGPSEEVIQQHIIGTLRSLGLRALQTTHRYKLQCCPRCAHRFPQQGGYGADKGVPDVLARDPKNDEKGIWVGLEVKSAVGRLKPEQKELEKEGSIIVVRSVDDALSAMEIQDE